MIHETTMDDRHVLTMGKNEFEELLEVLGKSDFNDQDLIDSIERIKRFEFVRGVTFGAANTVDDVDSWDSWDD